MAEWAFLTNHAQSLLFIAQDSDARLRDLADALGVTERTAHGLDADLVIAGSVVQEKEVRRNRYHLQDNPPLNNSIRRERTIGGVLELFVLPKVDKA